MVINLDKDTDRILFMRQQFEQQGISFERIKGVDGRHYLQLNPPGTVGAEYDESKAILKSRFGTALRPGVLGCALAHQQAYREFLTNPRYQNVKFLVIFEDDVVIKNNFKTILEAEIQKNLNRAETKRWNCLQFDYPQYNFNLFSHYRMQFNLFKKFSKNKFRRLPYLFFAPIAILLEQLRGLLLGKFFAGSYPVFMRVPSNLGCYVIDKKLAKKLIEENSPIINLADVNTDVVYQKYKKTTTPLIFFQYFPRISYQDHHQFLSSSSQIG